MNTLPSQRELMQPTIDVIKELGGSANIEEIYEKIVENLNLSDALLEIQNGKTGQSALQYNLAWVRTMLKNQGILENRGRGVWILKNTDLKSFKNRKNKKLNKAIIKEVEEEIEEEEK